MSAAEEFVDLIASGDKQRIDCVLLAAAGGAVTGGVGAGVAFAPANVVPGAGQAFNAAAAGVGAVLGALASGDVALKYCGGDETKGSLKRLFQVSRAPMKVVIPFEADLRSRYGLSAQDARLLTKAAIAYNASSGSQAISASENETRNAVSLLLEKLKAA